MRRLTENKIILVCRKTRLDDLVARFNTISQAKFYIESLGGNFSDYLEEHEQYNVSLKEAERLLSILGRVQKIERSFLPNFIFGKTDIVVVVGQDGLVANTIKYLDGQVVVGVNPDPKRWDGVILPFKVSDLTKIIPDVFTNKIKTKHVTMAEARLNNGQKLYAVNDLFIGAKTHVSARYSIQLGSKKENHSSSGIIVSTGLGSTGWLKSLLTGATEIAGKISGREFEYKPKNKFTWDSNYLYYTVREPFISKTSSASFVFGKITGNQPLKLTSYMPENGVIFSDGIEKDFLEFNSGTEATIAVANKQGTLVV